MEPCRRQPWIITMTKRTLQVYMKKSGVVLRYKAFFLSKQYHASHLKDVCKNTRSGKAIVWLHCKRFVQSVGHLKLYQRELWSTCRWLVLKRAPIFIRSQRYEDKRTFHAITAITAKIELKVTLYECTNTNSWIVADAFSCFLLMYTVLAFTLSKNTPLLYKAGQLT